MPKCVVLREDDADLAALVTELLEEGEYTVVHVTEVQALLDEAARLSPCVALIDGGSPTSFDLWWVGPILSGLGVPAIAFTAHASARLEFAANPSGFVGVISKPFDANEFVELIESFCWEESQAAAS